MIGDVIFHFNILTRLRPSAPLHEVASLEIRVIYTRAVLDEFFDSCLQLSPIFFTSFINAIELRNLGPHS